MDRRADEYLAAYNLDVHECICMDGRIGFQPPRVAWVDNGQADDSRAQATEDQASDDAFVCLDLQRARLQISIMWLGFPTGF